MRRVSAGNRMIPAPQIVKATNEDHQPITTVVYSAAESLKKLKDKLAKAQMPKDLEGEKPLRHAVHDTHHAIFIVRNCMRAWHRFISTLRKQFICRFGRIEIGFNCCRGKCKWHSS
jgi:hypothetical protein